MKKLLTVSAILVICLSLFTACKKEENGEKELKLDKTEINLVIDESAEIKVVPEMEGVNWLSSSSAVASVDDKGKVTANKSGSCEIECSYGDAKTTCKVNVYDRYVSHDVKADDPFYGKRKFITLNGMLDRSEEDDKILVGAGDYGEKLIISKSMSISSNDKASVKSVRIGEGCEVELKGLKFYTADFPAANDASLYCEERVKLRVEDCEFFVDKKSASEEKRIGGYAVYAAPNSQIVEIKKCKISNYRYGIYLSSTGADITIEDNSLSAMNTGIGVDIRLAGAETPTNLNATGTIKSNEYNDIRTKTEFYFAGDKYVGSLEFKDHEQVQSDKEEGKK